MTRWTLPLRPAAHAEQTLVTAILDGRYPPGSTLPGERELAGQLGITRPTLREALQRLERDGWLEIQHGKLTRVRNIWLEGGLNVLSTLVRFSSALPTDFIPNLLEVRLAMAPAYSRAAVTREPQQVAACLAEAANLEDLPADYADFDWRLHHTLTIASGNPVYTLILNGFAGFYEQMALLYFAERTARATSRKFYQSLMEAAQRSDPEAAEAVTRRVMQESLRLWELSSNPESSRSAA